MSQPTACAIPDAVEINMPGMSVADFDLLAEAAASFLRQLGSSIPAPSAADIAHDTRILCEPDRAQLAKAEDYSKCPAGAHWAFS